MTTPRQHVADVYGRAPDDHTVEIVRVETPDDGPMIGYRCTCSGGQLGAREHYEQAYVAALAHTAGSGGRIFDRTDRGACPAMPLDRARAIVARYAAAERTIERLFRPLVVAAFKAMQDDPVKGPGAPSARQYRAIMIGRGAAFKHLVRDIYDQYPTASVVADRASAADSRAALADTLALIDRISYGDGEEESR